MIKHVVILGAAIAALVGCIPEPELDREDTPTTLEAKIGDGNPGGTEGPGTGSGDPMVDMINRVVTAQSLPTDYFTCGDLACICKGARDCIDMLFARACELGSWFCHATGCSCTPVCMWQPTCKWAMRAQPQRALTSHGQQNTCQHRGV